MEQSRAPVALFLPSLEGGGAERVMLNLAAGLAQQGLAVDLILSSTTGPYVKEIPPHVRLVEFSARRVVASLPKLIRYLRQRRPSAVISALDHANVVALWATVLAGTATPIAVTVHHTGEVYRKPPPAERTADGGAAAAATPIDHRTMRMRMMPALTSMSYRWADAIIAVSEGVADDLAAMTGIPRGRITVIYNPVITPALLHAAREPTEHESLFRGGVPVILGVGRLDRFKDFETLIRAFSLSRRKVAARLLILGEGDDRPRLEALRTELGLDDEVLMPGFVTNPYAYMARAGVFVLSSRFEGLPTVLIEAAGVGAPIVATDCESGPREILRGGEFGRLVPVGDPETMAHAIIEVLSEPERHVVPLAALRAFSLDSIVPRYLEALDLGHLSASAKPPGGDGGQPGEASASRGPSDG